MRGQDHQKSGRLMFVNGIIVSISGFDFIKEMMEPKVLGFFVLSATIGGYLHPFLSKSGMEVWMQIVVIVIGASIFFCAMCVYVGIGLRIVQKLKHGAIPITIVILASNITVEVFMSWFIPAIWGRPLIETYNATFRIVATNQITYFILEVFFTIYILPEILENFLASKELDSYSGSYIVQSVASTSSPLLVSSEAEVAVEATASLPAPEIFLPTPENAVADQFTQPAHEIAAPPRGTHILLGGYRIRISDISMIKAEEHYIRIFLPTETLLIRFRLSDAAAMLPDSLGTLAHRSYWVAYNFVRRTQPVTDGRLTIEMLNGQTLVIPRARRKSFEVALRERAGNHLLTTG